MIAKKVIRYYSDCGRGFWKKQSAVTHDAKPDAIKNGASTINKDSLYFLYDINKYK